MKLITASFLTFGFSIGCQQRHHQIGQAPDLTPLHQDCGDASGDCPIHRSVDESPKSPVTPHAEAPSKQLGEKTDDTKADATAGHQDGRKVTPYACGNKQLPPPNTEHLGLAMVCIDDLLQCSAAVVGEHTAMASGSCLASVVANEGVDAQVANKNVVLITAQGPIKIISVKVLGPRLTNHVLDAGSIDLAVLNLEKPATDIAKVEDIANIDDFIAKNKTAGVVFRTDIAGESISDAFTVTMLTPGSGDQAVWGEAHVPLRRAWGRPTEEELWAGLYFKPMPAASASSLYGGLLWHHDQLIGIASRPMTYDVSNFAESDGGIFTNITQKVVRDLVR